MRLLFSKALSTFSRPSTSWPTSSSNSKTITEREAVSKNAPESEHGHRVDLSVTAQTTYSELQKRKSKWILVRAFRPGLPVSSSAWISRRLLDTDCIQKSEAKDEARAAPANSSLRASAAEFKPNGACVPPSTEVEDGEVKGNRAGNRPARGRELLNLLGKNTQEVGAGARENSNQGRQSRELETGIFQGLKGRPPVTTGSRKNSSIEEDHCFQQPIQARSIPQP